MTKGERPALWQGRRRASEDRNTFRTATCHGAIERRACLIALAVKYC
jgi:hypothetical protein